jgi:hypothetical protein
LTPFGFGRARRQNGEVLQGSLRDSATLDSKRRSMTDYNFAAQYQQTPQPASGIIVKREWLKFYTPSENAGAYQPNPPKLG